MTGGKGGGCAIDVEQQPHDMWFGSSVTPYAPVSAYAAAPPRGMTNPPRNPEVRRKLLEDLEAYGVPLQAAEWPPPLSAPSPASSVGRSSARKSPMAAWKRSGSGCLDVAIPQPRQGLPSIGMPDFTNCATREEMSSVMRADHPSSPGAVGAGLRFQPASASGWRPSPELLGGVRPLRRAESCEVPGAGNSVAARSGEAPGPVAKGGKKSGKEGGLRVGSKELAKSGKEKDPEQDPWQSVQPGLRRVLSDSELHNNMAALRAQGRLHRAAVSDQFRFSADLAAHGGMVIAGAGAAPTAPGAWASYASHLNVFHNKAMRVVNPSRLELRPTVNRRRRRKGEDELQLSDSGLFFSRYQADPAYRTIRRIRKAMFPEHEEAEKPKAISPEDAAAQAAEALKEEFKGLKLF